MCMQLISSHLKNMLDRQNTEALNRLEGAIVASNFATVKGGMGILSSRVGFAEIFIDVQQTVWNRVENNDPHLEIWVKPCGSHNVDATHVCYLSPCFVPPADSIRLFIQAVDWAIEILEPFFLDLVQEADRVGFGYFEYSERMAAEKAEKLEQAEREAEREADMVAGGLLSLLSTTESSIASSAVNELRNKARAIAIEGSDSLILTDLLYSTIYAAAECVRCGIPADAVNFAISPFLSKFDILTINAVRNQLYSTPEGTQDAAEILTRFKESVVM